MHLAARGSVTGLPLLHMLGNVAQMLQAHRDGSAEVCTLPHYLIAQYMHMLIERQQVGGAADGLHPVV